jgi:hypothetical protein
MWVMSLTKEHIFICAFGLLISVLVLIIFLARCVLVGQFFRIFLHVVLLAFNFANNVAQKFFNLQATFHRVFILAMMFIFVLLKVILDLLVESNAGKV